jgi:hypothetical protein|tara:strand:+ start:411 stop:851 length:441 start_codon:yes stop_codon:yes gene_type:complete
MAKKGKTNYINPDELSAFMQDEMDSLQRTEKMDWGYILLNQIERINKCATFIPRGPIFQEQYICAVKQLYDLLFAEFTREFKDDMKKLNDKYIEWYRANQKTIGGAQDPGQFYHALDISNYRYYMLVFRLLMRLASRKGLMGSVMR